MTRLNLLGVDVDPVRASDLNRAIQQAVQSSTQLIIANHNLHSVYLYHHDADMRSFYSEAHLIHIDGMPLVYWGKALGHDLRTEHRITYLDWLPSLMRAATTNSWRMAYIGGRPGVAERAAERLRVEHPGLQLVTHHGYFDVDGTENDGVLELLRQHQPQVLLVGMGMPRQERWVQRNWDGLTANAVLTAGACFDYIAGEVPTPPRWLGVLGLEWFYRLAAEPSRLWKRYLFEPLALIPHLYGDLRNHRLRRSRKVY